MFKWLKKKKQNLQPVSIPSAPEVKAVQQSNGTIHRYVPETKDDGYEGEEGIVEDWYSPSLKKRVGRGRVRIPMNADAFPTGYQSVEMNIYKDQYDVRFVKLDNEWKVIAKLDKIWTVVE
jgi:hypothetical protein